jgi:hypothetical protein
MQAAMRMLGKNRYHPYVIVADDRQQQHRSKSLGRCEEDQPSATLGLQTRLQTQLTYSVA